MKRRLCPQCKIPNFYVLNEKKERRLVFVTVEFEVIAAKEGESLEGFDLTVIYCLGCSWSGSPSSYGTLLNIRWFNNLKSEYDEKSKDNGVENHFGRRVGKRVRSRRFEGLSDVKSRAGILCRLC